MSALKCRLGLLWMGLFCMFIQTDAFAVSKLPLCVCLGVPAYSYPGANGDFWKNSSLASSGSVFVMNPNSGSGASSDPAYVNAVNQAHIHHLQVYGYVDTAYGKRDSNAVLQDAHNYQKWYRVDGIFLDDALLNAQNYSYYVSISKGLRKTNLSIAFNPGQPQIEKEYTALADHIVTFEGNYSTYLSAIEPAWMKNAPAHLFWHIVYQVPDITSFQAVMQHARQQNAGLIFVTSQTLPNPYAAIPPYWSTELQSTSCH